MTALTFAPFGRASDQRVPNRPESVMLEPTPLLQHPLSKALPAIPADEYQQLLSSTFRGGVRHPITVSDEMVIEGWDRYRASGQMVRVCPSMELVYTDP